MKPSAVLLLTAVVLGVACGAGSQIEQVVIENETAYPLQVEVSDGDAETWLPLGVAPPNAERVTERVTDKGETWIFRFTYAGIEAGRLRLGREELVDNDWRVRAPEELGKVLRDEGMNPPGEETGSR